MRPVVLVLALSACQAPDPSTDGDPVDRPGDTTEDPGTDTPDTPDTPRYPPPPASAAVQRGLTDGTTLVLDPDLGAILVYQENGAVRSIPVGPEPTRLVRLGADWFVTLRASGELVRLHEADGELVETGRRHVGAEPFDVVASRHRDVLYVSVTQEGSVVAIDPVTLDETDRWTFEREPRWLATTDVEADERLIVAEPVEPVLHVIDPTGVVETTVRELAALRRFDDPGCKPRDLRPRITGSVTITPDGEVLVPSVYLDTELIEPDHLAWRTDQGMSPTFDVCEDAGEDPMEPGHFACHSSDTIYYECIFIPGGKIDDPTVIGHYNPTVVAMDLFGDAPDETISVAGRVAFGPDSDTNRSPLAMARGIPSSVVASDDGGFLFVTLPTQGAVIVLNRDAALSERSIDLVGYRRGTVPVAAGPEAAVYDPSTREVVVWSALARRLQKISLLEVSDGMAEIASPSDPEQILEQLAWSAPAPPSPLTPQVQRGRLLFHSADLAVMTSQSSGVACVNCHPGGRSDGVLWGTPFFAREAPSIVGHVSDTAPFKWTGTVAELWTEIQETTNVRMAGDVSEADARAIAAYVDSLRPVVRPTAVDPAAAARGAAFFAAACATCHAGPATTDGATHGVPGGLVLDTPSLRGVAASGPWFHDGRAATLAEVVTTAHADGMTPVSDVEAPDLVAWLQTL